MRLKIMAVALALAASPAAAQVENLRVAPHPVPYPSFDSQKNENTALSLSYVHSNLKVSNPSLSLNGFDLGLGYRRALNDDMAWDAHFSIVPEFGSTSAGTKIYNVAVPLSTNFEYQPYRSQALNVILFAGPNIQLGSGNYEYHATYSGNAVVPSGNGVATTGSTSWIYGLQFGAQAGVNAGPVTLVPFFSMSPDWITYTRKYFSNNNIVSKSGSTSAAMMTTIGAQAWLQNGLGFHFTYQTVPGTSGFKTYDNILTGFNWAF